MKKRTLALLIIVSVLLCSCFVAQAAEPNYCPYCGSSLNVYSQHIDHWTQTRVFKDLNGASVTCQEFHSVDRTLKNCPNGCAYSYTGPSVETVTHSLASCPYK